MGRHKLRDDAKRLIENHLLGIDPDAKRFIDIISDVQPPFQLERYLNMLVYLAKSHSVPRKEIW